VRPPAITCTFRTVRVVGALVFLAASAATALAIRAATRRNRPADVLFAIAAPVAALIALVGLLLVFVPDFFG
jgi:hypothetical protein